MDRFKIAAMILILSAGIIGAWLIIENSYQTAKFKTTNASSSIESIKEKLAENPIDWIEKIIPKFTDNSEKPANQKTIKSFNEKSANLTDLVSQSMFGKMQKLDQKGENPFTDFDSKNPESQKLIQETINNLNFNPDSFFNWSINEKEIKISQDNSKQAKQKYFETIGEISKKHFNGFNKNYAEVLSEAFEKKNFSFAVQLSGIYKNIAEEYLNLIVPSDLTQLHKKIIIHLKTAQEIYQSVANFNIDPIKTYFAVEMIDKLVADAEFNQNLINEEFQKIQ